MTPNQNLTKLLSISELNFKKIFYSLCLIVCFFTCNVVLAQQNENMTIDMYFPYEVNAQTLGRTPIAGDTIFIDKERTRPLKFESLLGNSSSPIVIINKGGQVKIDGISNNEWGALTFENCKYIKLSGAGHPGYKYGFELSAVQSGVAFAELSSDCETEFVKISHNGFFGIVAKKDYHGNPPTPYPVFNNLKIHDCFIEGVSEGLYLGETQSPGMEFKHVRIYNNIIRNTLRESIQIANMVEDVEIYNNTMINAGLEGVIYHMNNLQIGNNSVATVYNNIMTDAPEYGIANFGKGDNLFFNNYIANNKGVFIDNRSISDSLATSEISSNYFKSMIGNEVVRNLNEVNDFIATDNVYDSNILFYKDENGVDNETLSNNTITIVDSIQYTDPSTNDYSLASNTPVQYAGIGAPGGLEFFPYTDPNTEVRQIVISPNMITDNVIGGSVVSPLYLFDEQSLDINSNQQAVSNSWKPFYNMSEDSYHTTLDLGDEHYISQINLHDMNDVHDFVVEYFDGTNWITLFTEPCNGFNVWKTHNTDISTRYLRFSMYNSVFAAVNEIIIYGYPLIKQSQQIVVNSSMVTDLVNGGSVYSPNLMFDEQSTNIFIGEHPTSSSWKPYYNNTKAPYYSVVDLESEYRLSKIALHDMYDINDIVVEYSLDGENWTILFTESLDKFNYWQTHNANIVTKYLRFTMLDSPYASVNEVLLFGYPVMTLPEVDHSLENQIIITSDMVIDEVSGGSVDSPLYLFDEQETANPELGEHPESKNWKPFYNNSRGPYHTTVDLGQEYHITKIYIHDTHASNDFDMFYDDNANWSHLLTESCNAFKKWKVHEVDIYTSKVRLSMLQSPHTGVNEVIFIGTPVGGSRNMLNYDTESNLADKVIFETEDISTSQKNTSLKLFPNPVNNQLNLRFPEGDNLGNQNIKILDATGKKVFEQNYSGFISKDKIQINQMIKSSGFYMLVYNNAQGDNQTIKFYKN